MKQAHIIVSGYVQGVWYRKFVKTNATKLRLGGWVRNTTNGKVEAVLQGEKKAIDNMIELCHKGPPFAEVKNVEVEWGEGKDKFRDFSTR